MDYKDTLNLPRTSFSMKANLPQKEPQILKKWEEDDIYNSILAKRGASDKRFILHDGPPYANGHIHMGHVLNKILKDICVKYFTMTGHLSPYVPGWDCHGLPVEHQLFKELGITKHDISQADFRKKAYDYALKYVKIQSGEFKRLGVFGDWEKPYLTLTKDYEADILDVLAALSEKGYIYKDLKPVNWCATCETALAEAEVEYEDKTSPSIYIKFKALSADKTFFVIWTTTPWTLLANVAVALHPDFMYSFVEKNDEIWIMLSDLVAELMNKFGVSDYRVKETITGSSLVQRFKEAKHPFIDRASRVVMADYVTKQEGTGCVHIAPGHGEDDYITGKKNNLPVIMPVDSSGKFDKEAGEFAGKHVLAANKGIVEKLRERDMLIKFEELMHSYPHCWRCKNPIIFRATKQWFMSLDHSGLRDKTLSAIRNDVKWIPKEASERIGSMVEMRPDWCLSRQRYWGVPIPAFTCLSCGETFTNGTIIKKISELTRCAGGNVWFEKNIEELLPKDTVCKKCGGEKFAKENDILDVWFDSGVSFRAVLKRREDLTFPADLYLEGSDQHRGWFQAAILTSMASMGKTPYRSVLTHGFVVDAGGKKMSKSIGNVINPEDIMKKYGADILRLWVASSAYEGDIKLSDEILERLADGYRKIRNTFKFLLSNLYDFNFANDAIKFDELEELDKWMMSRLYHLTEEVSSFYNSWEFHRVYHSVYNFCVYEISAFYLDIVKDALYVEAAFSHARRSTQTVLFHILDILVRIVAPILSFTAEEVWSNFSVEKKEKSVHMTDWPDMEKSIKHWMDRKIDEKWDKLLAIRNGIMKKLEEARQNGVIGSSLEAAVFIYSDNGEMRNFINENIKLFPMIFKVSQASLADKNENNMEKVDTLQFCVKIVRAKGKKCGRCWNFSETVEKIKDFPDLCQRCYNVVSERRHA